MGYFKHASNARNDEKLRGLARELRWQFHVAYATWFIFLECANEEGDHGRIDLGNGPIDGKRLCEIMEISIKSLPRWIQATAKLGLIHQAESKKTQDSLPPQAQNGLDVVVWPASFESYVGEYSRRKLAKDSEQRYLAERTTSIAPTSLHQRDTNQQPNASSIYLSSSNREEKKEQNERKNDSSGKSAAETIIEISRLFKGRWHRKVRLFPRDEHNLATKIRDWDSEVVLKAYKEYLSESGDYLLKNRHPFGVFIKQFELYVVEEEPQPPQAPKQELVEHEGNLIPAWLRDEKLRDKEIMAEKQRKREEKEKEEAALLAIQESTPL